MGGMKGEEKKGAKDEHTLMEAISYLDPV